MRFLAENEDGDMEIFEAESFAEAEDHCLSEVWELQGEIIAIIDGEDKENWDAALEHIDFVNIVTNESDLMQ